MTKSLIFILLLLTATGVGYGQQSNLAKRIDSLIACKTKKPFNGVILISQDGKTKYSKVNGYSDIERKTPLLVNDQFVIGSISKQFTAVLVLQEFDKGHINLFVPIHNYLPELTQNWADTVTVHNLLTHTHGVTELDKPTTFKVGAQFAYSQIGYDLLAKIIERTSGKSFAELSKDLFKKCRMTNTFHPNIKEYKNLVKGYTEQENGIVTFDSSSLDNYAAAGAFISTANDLILWNQNLQNGKLLKKSSFAMMMTKQKNAIRQHPIFGVTEYGYGITIDTKENILQLGQTGFAPGFVSMDFYFPRIKTSVVVFENVAYDSDDIKKTFYYLTEILKILKESGLTKLPLTNKTSWCAKHRP